MRALWLVCALAIALLPGCAINREGASVSPDANLSQIRKFHVVRFAPDERGIEAVIAGALRKRGLEASSGSEDAAPGDIQALVTYQDRWRWDITMYMLELKIYIREPQTGRLLAMGSSHHTSLSRRTPEEMASEVLANIFKEARK